MIPTLRPPVPGATPAQQAAQQAAQLAALPPSVMLINQAAADLLFPDADPLGRRMTMTGNSTFEIIGVVGNIRHVGLGEKPRPETYMHTLQGPLTTRNWWCAPPRTRPE